MDLRELFCEIKERTYCDPVKILLLILYHLFVLLETKITP